MFPYCWYLLLFTRFQENKMEKYRRAALHAHQACCHRFYQAFLSGFRTVSASIVRVWSDLIGLFLEIKCLNATCWHAVFAPSHVSAQSEKPVDDRRHCGQLIQAEVQQKTCNPLFNGLSSWKSPTLVVSSATKRCIFCVSFVIVSLSGKWFANISL